MQNKNKWRNRINHKINNRIDSRVYNTINYKVDSNYIDIGKNYKISPSSLNVWVVDSVYFNSIKMMQ